MKVNVGPLTRFLASKLLPAQRLLIFTSVPGTSQRNLLKFYLLLSTD